jgi:Txe/YoeB family toxin of Txe-Axe toxin-antitoxin module
MSRVEIEYDNKNVEALFSDFELMKKKTDAVFTKLVKKKYEQIKAFDNFADFIRSGIGKPHPLSGDKDDCYGVNITGSKRLVVCPISQNLSMTSLQLCKKIIIKGVENYHGSKTTSYIP